jgi:hypothetical protein
MKTKRLTLKIAVSIAALFIARAAYANIDCDCPSMKNHIECQAESNSKSPTWWDWITGDKSSQLHFFQIIELLNSDSQGQHSANIRQVQDNKEA